MLGIIFALLSIWIVIGVLIAYNRNKGSTKTASHQMNRIFCKLLVIDCLSSSSSFSLPPYFLSSSPHSVKWYYQPVHWANALLAQSDRFQYSSTFISRLYPQPNKGFFLPKQPQFLNASFDCIFVYVFGVYQLKVWRENVSMNTSM